ncbi:Gfo/Idh/MocA family oxidoreductase [Actinomadura macrotermitis]|uniref:Scyllo-inositol 2-dehydrogenase (NADP(+)) IolW n=1 Tax=Actinomadura macrotermitis TaxID=2585200 RepID=A0A7K0C6W5_9ACTN|nr:Gfo/Idh/MocA family oxidoreductase [Actinomadura macrotermitis]MQY09158.1 scyllo-inositol 2-dehydrogenase (NADP(+)) IolW [Actinomadura macrotermitis]
MTLRVALIGYGTGGAVFHAPLISSVPGLALAAVVTGNPGRQAAVRERYPEAKVLDSADRLWEANGAYDLVVVTAPNRQHVPLARTALTTGLPVVVDKPVAATAADARSLAALSAVRGLPVFPFHNRRWDGDFRTVRGLAGSGALGPVHRFESRFERWRPEVKEGWKESTDPRDAGGILYDLGPHLVDQAIVLFGRPTEVYAEIDTRRPGAAAPDDVFVALTHPGGERSHLWASATAAQLGPRFRVLGGEASYVVSGMDGQEDALRAGRSPLDPGWGQAPPEAYGLLGTPGSERPEPTLPGAYQDFYAGVERALRGQEPPPVTLADAIAGLEVIEAAQHSARDGQVVHLRPATT